MKYNHVDRRIIRELKNKVDGIFVDCNTEGTGFIVALNLKNGRREVMPDNIMSLEEAVGFSTALGKLIKLPDERVLISKSAILRNRLSDIGAFKMCKAISAQGGVI